MGESAVSGLKSFRVEKATLKAGLLLSAQSIVFLFLVTFSDERGKNIVLSFFYLFLFVCLFVLHGISGII